VAETLASGLGFSERMVQDGNLRSDGVLLMPAMHVTTMGRELVDAIADAVATRPDISDDRPLLTSKQLAVRLNVSKRQAREMVNGSKGKPAKIPSLIVGDGSRRIRPADPDAYIAAQEAAGS
jgi:hypothetical protein